MSLLDLALADQNLLAAWQRVCENDGAPGSDGVTLEAFGAGLMQRLAALRAQVREGRYATQPLLEVALERPGKSPRLLGIPAVRDRVLQTAVTLVLMPILDPHFEDTSFAYRPGRSVAMAVDRVVAGRQRGYRWVVDADIHGFFDAIPHEALIGRLHPFLADQTLLPLIRQWLGAPTKTSGGMRKRTLGVPQGAPISPLFANLYLDPFDETMLADPARWLVRYADDFVILTKSQDDAEQALEEASRWLEANGLMLNFDKTRVSQFASGFDFLGVRFEGETQWAIDPESAPWVLPKHLRPYRPATKPVASAKKSALAGRRHSCPAHPVPCIPHEVEADHPALSGAEIDVDPDAPPLLRTIYLSEPGAYLHREGERIVINKDEEELISIPIEKIDQVFVTGEGAISFGALRWLMRKQVVVLVADAAGQPVGAFRNDAAGHIRLRRRQFERGRDAAFALSAAQAIVAGKVANSRLLLRRYYRFRTEKHNPHDPSLAELQQAVARAASLNAVRGHEGAAARLYFDGMRGLLSPQWDFTGRRRQPPVDPVNAMFSYGYGILYHTLLTLLCRHGLDPHVGTLHADKEHHASLASDLMEEFRPLVVDAVVLKLLLSGKVSPADFEYGGSDYPVRLSTHLRKEFVTAVEAKMTSPLTHPYSGKTIDYRRAMLYQVAHWADVVTGIAPIYRPLVLR